MYGHQPDHQTVKRLWQAAILDTRDAKKPAESLADLRATWAQEVRALDDGESLLARVADLSRVAEDDTRPSFFPPADQMRDRLLEVGVQALELFTETILPKLVVDLTPPEPLILPAQLHAEGTY